MPAVTVGGVMQLQALDFPEPALEDLRVAFRYANPACWQDRFAPKWTYGIVEGFYGIDVPRGAVSKLRAIASAHELSLSFSDERSEGEVASYEHRPPGELTHYQKRCSAKLRGRIQGCVVVPCGGGKTVLALDGVAKIGRTFLVIVHTKDLRDQWVGAIRKQLGVEADTALGGTSPACVITVQTLANMGRLRLGSKTRRYAICIVDEAHHVPSITFQRVLTAIFCRWRWALTATPDREDRLEGLLFDTVGPILYAVHTDEVVAAGRLVKPTVYRVKTGFSYPEAKDYAQLLAAITLDDKRTSLVASLVRRLVGQGRKVIVLSIRVALCDQLGELLEESGVSVAVVHGTKRGRVAELARFREGGADVLCATTLADEGLDIPSADTLVLITPSRAKGRAIQRVGRVLRNDVDKLRPLVFDLVDGHKTAQNQWGERRKAYVRSYGKASISTRRIALGQLIIGGYGG